MKKHKQIPRTRYWAVMSFNIVERIDRKYRSINLVPKCPILYKLISCIK